MNLDQAEPAGIVDDPDSLSLTDSDTTTSSYRADDDGSWARALLRRGWDLSRKAAIAGAAATAAPVVGPPLIVLSAAGVVLSVPFAAYLASLAATNQLMGALLPSSPPQPYGNWDQEDGDLEEEFFDAPEEYGKEVLAFGRWNETEEDAIKEGKESAISLPKSRDPGVYEVPVPALSDEEVEGEFAVAEESGQESVTPNTGDGAAVEENGHEEVPALGPWNRTEEESASVTLSPLSRGAGVSDVPVPVPALADEEKEGEFAVKDSGEELVIPKGDKIEDATAMEENDHEEAPALGHWNETEEGTIEEENASTSLPPISREPAVSEVPVPELAYEELKSAFAANESSQFVPDSGGKAEDSSAITKRETPLEGFDVSESLPLLQDQDNVFQSKGEDEVAVQVSGQEPLASKDRDETEDGTIMDGKVASRVTPPLLPVSSDDDIVLQRDREGEFAVQKPDKDLPVSDSRDSKKEEKEPTDDMPLRNINVPESSVPVCRDEGNVDHRKGELEVPVEMMVEEEMTTIDLVKGEVVDMHVDIVAAAAPENEDLQPSNVVIVQTDIVAAAAPGNEDLQPSNLAGPESLADPAIGEVVEVQSDIVAAATPENEDLQPSNLPGSESLADPVREEVVVVQSDIVAAAVPESQMLPPSNVAGFESPADLVTGEVVEEQANIVVAAALESVLLPPSNLPAMESSADLIMGEVIDVQAGITAATVSENEMPPSGNLVACVDLSTGEVVDVQAENVAAAAPESEVLPPSILAACESPAAAAAAYDSAGVGITVMQDVVMDFGDVNRDRVERRFVTVAPVMSVPDDEDAVFSGSRPYIFATGNEIIDQINKATGVGYTIAEDEEHYTEEQLREQLDMIRTITGYRAAPSWTLEGELAGLYVFVGVEPPVESTDASLLLNLNAKLRFLKSIIGVD